MATCTDLVPGEEDDGIEVLPEGDACALLAFLVRSFLTLSGSVAMVRSGVTVSASACMASVFDLTSAMEGDEDPDSWDDEDDEDHKANNEN